MTETAKKIIDTEKLIGETLVTLESEEFRARPYNKEVIRAFEKISGILADIYYDLRRAEYNDQSTLMSNTQIAEMLSYGYGEVKDEDK